jgi:hypothetical protein
MKKILFVISFSYFGFIVNGQINLVPNPGFEQDTACPNQPDQIYKLKDWFKTNASPDYFNICYNGPGNFASIPLNTFGYQNQINNCHSYSGLLSMSPGPYGSSENIASENIAIKLTTTLSQNVKYYFSTKISLANNSKYATNNFGAFFTTYSLNPTTTRTPTNFSHIKFNQVIADTLNWVNLFKSFIPDSNYQYISIGNFYDTLNTTEILYNPQGYVAPYYFIDNVCLSTDSAFTYNYNFDCSYTSLKEEAIKKIFISPNPAINKITINSEFLIDKIEIITTSGQIIYSLYKEEKEIQFNLNQGIYFVKITSKDNIIYKKLIINP